MDLPIEVAIGQEIYGRGADGSIVITRVCGLASCRGEIFAVLLRSFVDYLRGDEVFADNRLLKPLANRSGAPELTERFVGTPYVATALLQTSLVSERTDYATTLCLGSVGAVAAIEEEKAAGTISSTDSRVRIDGQLIDSVGVVHISGQRLNESVAASRFLGRRLLSMDQVVGSIIAVSTDRLFFSAAPGYGWDGGATYAPLTHQDVGMATAANISDWNRGKRRRHLRSAISSIPSLLSQIDALAVGAEEAVAGLVENASREGRVEELLRSLQVSGLLIDLHADRLIPEVPRVSDETGSATFSLAVYAKALIDEDTSTFAGGDR